MPDHVHGLLFVTREMQAHLGKVVNGFKVGCNKALRQLRGVSYPEAMPVLCPEAVPVLCPEAVPVLCPEAMPQKTKLPKHPQKGMLFAPGYQDSVLRGKDQLERMFRYIADNPRRLAVKRANPELFRRVNELRVPVSVPVLCPEAMPQETKQPQGTQQPQGAQQPQETKRALTFAAIGNRWLLDRPLRLQVRCHNNTTEANLRLIERQKAYFLERGEKEGAVVVSPCISAGEKEIARAALDAGTPLIVILENGFPPMYKPPGKYFEACAKGLLLMLAPWPYHMEKRTITRLQCLALNDMAHMMSTEPWTQELEEKLLK